MVLDIGGKSTTITIISENKEIITRVIEFGIEQMRKVLDMVQSEINYISHQKEEYFSNIMRPQIEYNILSEVERVLRFYDSSFKHSGVKKIYLIGGGSYTKGIGSYIGDALNIPSEKISQLETIKIGSHSDFKENISYFVNILGAINGV